MRSDGIRIEKYCNGRVDMNLKLTAKNIETMVKTMAK